MKKTLSFCMLVALATTTAWAAGDFPRADFPSAEWPSSKITNQGMQQAVSQALELQVANAQTSAKKPHDAAVFDMELRVHSKFEKQLQGDNERIYDKPCSAVLIDQHWLLASLSCRGVGEYASAYDHYGNVAMTKKVAYRKIEKASIRAHYMNSRDDIWARDIFTDEGSQLILLYLDPTNTSLMDEINDNGTVIASMLIPDNPSSVTNDAIDNAYINRERWCEAGRCSDAVDVAEYCTNNGCYKIGLELVDGDAGDPLFVVSKQNSDNEYLIAFNNAEIIGSDTQSGKTYKALNKSSLNFIKKIVSQKDKAAWNRIAQRTKQETAL